MCFVDLLVKVNDEYKSLKGELRKGKLLTGKEKSYHTSK